MPNAKNHMPVFMMGGLLIVYGLIVKTGALLPKCQQKIDIQPGNHSLAGIENPCALYKRLICSRSLSSESPG